MAIDQERAEIWLAANGFADSRVHSATEIAELLTAYAAEERRAERKRCADIARTLLTNQGDQYGSCMVPSPDGETIAGAIEREG